MPTNLAIDDELLAEVCAAALRRDLSIYTTDADFRHYTRVLRLTLHAARS